ncbi:hypothetical protein EZV62_026824 [Acer yangbiense]|uniref:Uncharacterized protein n=1 Tax=Acer yangbiense TaxID=1000413 RepID=A0A5C7GSK8_9ROSI|nr:hypothetical protein EZV62_026824 [Acer yangbiense]
MFLPPPFDHHLNISLSAITRFTTMAVLVLSVCESDNKENIPPFSSKQITLVSANKRRRVRHPLRDITNLLKSQVEYSSPVSPTNATSLVSFQSNRRKRRTDEAGLESMFKKTRTFGLFKSKFQIA